MTISPISTASADVRCGTGAKEHRSAYRAWTVSKAQCGGYSGGNKPYGYYCVDGMLMQNPEERPIVETVFREHDENHTSLLDICEILYDGGYRTRKGKRFQPSTIRGILSNRPFYEGKYKNGDMGWVQGVHSPILPLEV